MVRAFILTTAYIAAAFCFMQAPAFAATGRAVPCSDGSLGSLASHTHGKITPCVARPHRLIIETTYYQNASKIGGTALAAFPEARVRYGVAPHWELFVDTPSEIAKSGQAGRGIYVMTQTGYGMKFELARIHNVVYSLSAESHPSLGALANQNLRPLSDVHVSANWEGEHRRSYAAEVGFINYETVERVHLRGSLLLALGVTQTIDPSTALTVELQAQSHVLRGSRSQTSGIVSLQRVLSSHLLFNVELGTSFNESANSKPHYLGAGFTIH